MKLVCSNVKTIEFMNMGTGRKTAIIDKEQSRYNANIAEFYEIRLEAG